MCFLYTKRIKCSRGLCKKLTWLAFLWHEESNLRDPFLLMIKGITVIWLKIYSLESVCVEGTSLSWLGSNLNVMKCKVKKVRKRKGYERHSWSLRKKEKAKIWSCMVYELWSKILCFLLSTLSYLQLIYYCCLPHFDSVKVLVCHYYFFFSTLTIALLGRPCDSLLDFIMFLNIWVLLDQSLFFSCSVMNAVMCLSVVLPYLTVWTFEHHINKRTHILNLCSYRSWKYFI